MPMRALRERKRRAHRVGRCKKSGTNTVESQQRKRALAERKTIGAAGISFAVRRAQLIEAAIARCRSTFWRFHLAPSWWVFSEISLHGIAASHPKSIIATFALSGTGLQAQNADELPDAAVGIVMTMRSWAGEHFPLHREKGIQPRQGGRRTRELPGGTGDDPVM